MLKISERRKSWAIVLVSFNDLVGARQQRWRNRKAKRFCSFQVDDRLDLRRTLDRKIGRLVSLDDTRRISADQARGIVRVGSISHEPAPIDELALGKQGWNRVLRRRIDDLDATDDEQWIDGDEQHGDALACDGRECVAD